MYVTHYIKNYESKKDSKATKVVPQEINAFFTRNDARREYMPIGVNLFKNGKYVARINNGNGEYKHLGYFNSKSNIL